MSNTALDKNEWTWFQVCDLAIVWPNAQRPIRPGHLKTLCDNFNPDLFDPVHVTAVVKAPNLRHVIDGWHRRTMMEKLYGSSEQVPCIVHDDCTTEARAAEIFREINKARRAPTAVEDFKVGVTEGCQVNVEVDRSVRKIGFHISATPEGKGISAVAALMYCRHRYGLRPLDSALVVLRDTWESDRNAFQAPLISGYSAFLFEYPGADRDRLKSRIGKKFSPGSLVLAAKAAKQASNRPLAHEVKQTLVNYYNSGRGLTEANKLRAAKETEEKPARQGTRTFLNGSSGAPQLQLNAKSHLS